MPFDMSVVRRIVAPLALILVAGAIVWPLRDAFDAFIESRSYATPITWSLGMAWGFDTMWSVILGALLGALLRSGSAMAWAAAAGLAYGGLNFAMTQHHLSSALPWTYYVGVYGQYAVPCIGAVIGAWLSASLLGRDIQAVP
jgi:uncharacterized membrane protein (DUF2068 family)